MKKIIMDAEDFEMQMKLIKLESKLVYALSYFEEQAKLQLARLETIRNVSQILADHKNGSHHEWWMQLDPELKKTIRKYTGPYRR